MALSLGFEFTRNSVRGVENVAAGFGFMSRNIKKAGPKALRRIRDEAIKPGISRNFQFGRAGNPPVGFFPISEYTKKWRAAEGGNPENPPLSSGITSGRSALRNMAVANSRFRISGNRMTYGNWPANKRRTIRLLHEGGINAKGYHVPPRPFTDLDTEAVRKIEQIYEREVISAIAAPYTAQYISRARQARTRLAVSRQRHIAAGFIPAAGRLAGF